MDHYIKRKDGPNLNKFGFNEKVKEGMFYGIDYNDSIIATKNFRINTSPNLKLFLHNTALLYKLLDYAQNKDLKVIICTMPLYRTYLDERNPDILRRRDSILKLLPIKYKNVKVFERENDTMHFITSDYINHNHLNPVGAEKFSKDLNEIIQNGFKD